MQIKYKKIRIPVAHCGDCGERLYGNGSNFNPYGCKCGKWENSWQNPSEYKLKGEDK